MPGVRLGPIAALIFAAVWLAAPPPRATIAESGIALAANQSLLRKLRPIDSASWMRIPLGNNVGTLDNVDDAIAVAGY